MCAKEHKKLSEDKERYKSKKVLTENGVPVPGLWQRLKKYYVYVSVIKNGRIVPTFIPLKTRTLQKAIDECQKLQAYWAKERNNFKIHEITENALKEEVYLLSRVFASALRMLEKEMPSLYKNYSEDARNKDFLEKYKLQIDVHNAFFYATEAYSLDNLEKYAQLSPLQQDEWEKKQKQFENECIQLDQKARESIDNLFKEAVNEFDNEDTDLQRGIFDELVGTEELFGRIDLDSKDRKYRLPEKKLEGILMKMALNEDHRRLYEVDHPEIGKEKEENFSKALEHYQKNRRKSEELAFGTKSNTAFKIIQNVIYPLETQIRIVKALLRYCPKEDQEPKESK